MSVPVQVQHLAEGWSFKQTDDNGANPWLSVEKVPSVVHMDLMAHKK